VVRHRRPPGPGRGEGATAGARRRPERALASLSLLLLVAAVLTLLGGVAQINPVWQLGPSHPARVTSPAQPDWYLAFLDGLVRLAPPWSFELFGYTISELFWPALLFPAVAFGILTLWPWIERRLGGDRAEHDLLDRPRDAPLRTAVGAAGLTMFLVAFLAAGNDVLAVLLHLPLEAVTRLLQWLFVLGPVVVGLVTYAVCRSLRRSGLHPARAAAGLRLERTAAGGYRTAPVGPRRRSRPRGVSPAGSRAGADQPGLVGDHHQLGAVVGAQLDHGAADMGPGGRLANHQLLGDLLVAEPLTHQGQHHPHPLGEFDQAVLGELDGAAGGGELGDQSAGDPWCQQRLAGGYHAHGVQQLRRAAVLEQEPAGAGLQRLEHVLVGVVGGQHPHPLQPSHAGQVVPRS
jgi:hypothetical protein